jgi:thioredoxin-related protein
VIAVDVDQKNSPLYKQYGQYYPGQGIPHAVFLDENGKVLGTVGGYMPYPDLLQEFKQDTKGK